MSATDKVNILLVDDQPAKLLSYEVILSELGENLIKANSANEALQHLLRHEIAIVLIDVVMPDLNGFELAAMIREHPRCQRTAIIFVSAIQMSELDLLRGYQAGAVEYVPVPVVPELLRAKVRVFADLYRKTRQLEQLNTELERRVEERTAELAQANAELEHANAELEQRVEERTREREAALAQVHEMQKMESLGQLTGGVAHDFNNLLMVILGSLQLLQKQMPQDPRVLRLIDAAMQGAERGATLTRHMLAFARRQELRPATVDVPRLVAGMEELLRRTLGSAIEIMAEYSPDLPPVRVDPNQLELAVLNLALNARDAMPNGGRLIIAGHCQTNGWNRPAELSPGRYVCLSVSDNGVGMDKVTLKRAMEPFFTTKGSAKGTGLGLSMVHGLAAQSEGAMRISSRPGMGTTVELWLPVSPDTAAQDAPAHHSIAVTGLNRHRVLLVDDDALVVASTTAMLEDLGHSVIEALSAQHALDILRGGAVVDLVLTDHAMPGMTGSELARQIGESWPALPVILVTGYADLAGNIDPSLPRLSKPYLLSDLAAQIDKAMLAARSGNVIPLAAARAK
jgi:signal transduction histidine kinase